MPVSTSEGSVFWFPQASGFFTHDLAGRPDLGNAGGQLNGDGQYPSGLIMAQAFQSVTIAPRSSSQNLLAVGQAGIGGRNVQSSSVDVSISAVVTSGRRMGKTLAHMVPMLSGLEVITTDGIQTFAPVAGKKAHVSGLVITGMSWNFQANGQTTFDMQLEGDGVTWSFPTVPQGMDIDVEHTPATCDLFRIQYGSTNIFVSGLQSASFQVSFNREPVYALGDVLPFRAEDQCPKPVRWPPDVKVSLQALANHVVLKNWLEKFQTTYNAQDLRQSVIISVLEQATGNAPGQLGTRNWIVASGLVPTQATLGIQTNSFSNINLEFDGHELEF